MQPIFGMVTEPTEGLCKRLNALRVDMLAFGFRGLYPWFGVAMLLALAGCATQPAAQHAQPGFLMGLFHGFTAIAALVGSMFFHVRIYAFPNSGFWYDAGFVAGFSASVIVLVLISIARIGGFVTKEGS